MIDPVTVAIGATALSAVEGGVSLLQVKKNNDLKRDLNRQRVELSILEIGSVIAVVASLIDAHITKKRYMAINGKIDDRVSRLAVAVDELEYRINSINLSALDAKLDMVVAATATPKIIPVPTTPDDDKKEEESEA